jgi:N-acetyl-gamma-glutamyl-phosphate reductase
MLPPGRSRPIREARSQAFAQASVNENQDKKTSMSMKKKVAVLGASGYTGSDAVRLLARHPNVEVSALTANSHAGKAMSEVFPHFFALDLPDLSEWEAIDWTKQDAVVCGLPHGTTQEIIAAVLNANPAIKVLDMSADFRLRDKEVYARWYGHEHRALHLQAEAVYGLTEFYREKITEARLVACPGCYPTAVLLALAPLAKAGLVDVHDLIIDAKSGVTGSGRGLKLASLFSETGEGLSPYAIGTHRHSAEIEQEISVVAGTAVTVNFTPHLVPMARGELCTCYVRLNGATVDDLRAALEQAYQSEPFVNIAKNGVVPRTQNVRGSNHVQIGVFADRIRGRAIVIATLDNLVKGSAGQAIQNMNLMFGWPEATGLEQIALFP